MTDQPPPIEIVDLGGGDEDIETSAAVSLSGPPRRLLIGVAAFVAFVVGAALLWPSNDVSTVDAVYFTSGGQRTLLPSGPSGRPTQRWFDADADQCRGVLAAVSTGDLLITTRLGDSYDSAVDISGFVAVARQRETGQEQWRHDLGNDFAEQFVELADDRVLLATSGGVTVLDARSGAVVGEQGAGTRSLRHADGVVVVQDQRSLLGFDTDLTPLYDIELTEVVDARVVADTIVVLERGVVTAYETRTGARRWVERAGATNVQVLADGVIAQDGATVRFLDLDTGATRWSGLEINGDARAVGDDFWAAVSVEPREIRVFDASGSEAWQTSDQAGFIVGVTGPDGFVATIGEDGASIRDAATGVEAMPLPIDQVTTVSSRHLFVGVGSSVEAFHLRTGELAYRFDTDEEVCGLTVVDDGMLVSTESALSFYA